MSRWQTLLVQLGFSPHEAAVYLALHALGPSPAQAITEHATMARATTYMALDDLINRGLVSTSTVDKRTLYTAESPDRLLSSIRERENRFTQLCNELEQAIGEMKLSSQKDKPAVRMYEGREALRVLQDDVLASGATEFFEFGSLDAIHELYDLPREIIPFQKELVRRQVYGRGIWQKREPPIYTAGPFNQNKRLPDDTPPFYGHIMIYAEKVALSVFRGKHISIIINSKDLSEMFRRYFETLWKRLE